MQWRLVFGRRAAAKAPCGRQFISGDDSANIVAKYGLQWAFSPAGESTLALKWPSDFPVLGKVSKYGLQATLCSPKRCVGSSKSREPIEYG